jgi:hypothetical protein
MQRGRSISAAVLSALVLLAGCSSSSDPRAAVSTGPAATGSARAQRPAGPSASAAASKRAQAAAASQKAQAKKKKAGSGSEGDQEEEYTTVRSFPIAVRTVPGCVSVGDKIRIEIATEPKASLVISIFYSDITAKGGHSSGDADPEGRYVYAYQIPPEAPPGEASVDVVGEHRAKGAMGTATTSFTVALPGGCG